jgi:hypothetical protein
MKAEVSSEDADEYQSYLKRLMKHTLFNFVIVICRRLEKIFCSIQIFS